MTIKLSLLHLATLLSFQIVCSCWQYCVADEPTYKSTLHPPACQLFFLRIAALYYLLDRLIFEFLGEVWSSHRHHLWLHCVAD